MAEVDPGSHAEIEAAMRADLVVRQRLARTAVSAMAEMLDTHVDVGMLEVIAAEPEPSEGRLRARRALRCIWEVATPGSKVVAMVGEDGIYDYAEGVLEYGASQETYLALMNRYKLTAAQVTALYEVRRQVADYSDGQVPGFPYLLEALKSVGFLPQQAAQDPEAAVAALDEAGCFVDHAGGKTFGRSFFWPQAAGRTVLSPNYDTPRSEPYAWTREHFGDLPDKYRADTEDED